MEDSLPPLVVESGEGESYARSRQPAPTGTCCWELGRKGEKTSFYLVPRPATHRVLTSWASALLVTADPVTPGGVGAWAVMPTGPLTKGVMGCASWV